MNYFRTFLSLSVLTPGLVWTVFDARAQTCSQAPSCSQLGYTKTVSQCAGKNMIKCPFDTSLAYCEDGPSCASLGFTDTIAECPGDYTLCPSDSSKGKCIFEASPGDLKYSLRTSDHNGWLLCNGRSYSSTQYPELYSAISGSFGSYLPNYSGYFLKAAATAYASSLKTKQEAGLPNMTGKITGFWGYPPISTKTGVFSNSVIPGAYKNSTKNGGPIAEGIEIKFDASTSSSIYGRSTTVTPQNYSANVFIYAGRIKGRP